MPTRQQYLAQPLETRLERIGWTPDEIAAAIRGTTDAGLSRRPDGQNWSATEVICHLRDIEELFVLRFHMMLGTQEPTFLVLDDLPPDPDRWGIGGRIGMPLNPDRWAEERQYGRADAGLALQALRIRREETLIFLRRLSPSDWERSSIHVTLGHMTFADWVALIAAHDDNHLDQLRRALEGRP
jgi:DinB family protein